MDPAKVPLRGFSPRLWGRALWRDERAAAIVEFAFVLAPLLLVILGGMDLAYQAYIRSVLQGALNDVARTGSLEAPSFDCSGQSVEAKIGCAIQHRSDIVARQGTYRISMRSFYDFSGVGRSEKLVTDYNKNGKYDQGDCFVDLNENGAFDLHAGKQGIGGADDVVFYQVSLEMPRLFPVQSLLGFPASYTVEAETALRNQPYTRQRTPPTVCV